jgi:hypothetical protein
MRFFIPAAFLALFACACNPVNTDKTTKADSSVRQSSADTAKVHTAQPDVIEAGEHHITDKVELQKIYLLGKEVSCRYADIPEQLKQQLPGMMKAISDNKAVITGSYHIVLKENPSASAPTGIFIGIPVQKPVTANGFTVLTLAAGSYLRHQCASEPGKSLSLHQNILKAPFEKLRQKAGFPIIEKYSETRNDEMTSVISKATFYYTIGQ